MTTRWTHEQDEKVIALVRQGLSGPLIADAMGMSAGAVIGRLDRLRKAGCAVPHIKRSVASEVAPKKYKPRRERPMTLAVVKSSPETAAPMERATEGSFETGSVAADSAHETIPVHPEDGSASHVDAGESPATSHGVLITDRKSHQCAWPLWDDFERTPIKEPFICAAPIERGSYCAEHAARCYGGWRGDELAPFIERRKAA